MEDTITYKTMFVEDLCEAINHCPSMRGSLQIFKKIANMDDGTLVHVKMEIYKGTIIHDVNEITNEYIRDKM